MIAAFVALAFVSSRTTLNLDDGWQYTTLAAPPSIWSGADAVPTAAWKVVRVSSEETTAEKAPASQAFDGDPKTFWHTRWQGTPGGYPHELVLDLGGRTEAVGFRLLPRQTGPKNGHPNHLQVFLSDSLDSWGDPVVTGQVPDSSDLFQVRFTPHRGRYLRLVVSDGYQREPFLVLAEIGLIRSLDEKQKQDWESQYHIATVETGDARYDLRGAALEGVKQAELAKVKAADWKSATLPHAAWIRPMGKPEIWQGVAYYRRSLDVDDGLLAKHLELTIDGAMQVSDLWLNGQHVATHRGGYLPMVVDLTGKLGRRNDLLVRVDNRDNPLVPPGKPQQDLDFMYGAGLTRHAWLTATSKLRITDALEGAAGRFGGGVYVTDPVVEADRATVRVRTHVANETGKTCEFQIRQNLGGRITTSGNVRLKPGEMAWYGQDLKADGLPLWSPSSTATITLRTSLVSSGEVEDSVDTSVGIRKIEVSREKGFVINGKSIELMGTNRHQDYPWVGPALSDAANVRDVRLIKLAGHNIVRLSHYPQSEAFLDECDRMGLMVIPCIPGWQFLNKDTRFTEAVRQDIRNLIRRDRNHPSVAFWETSLNETYPPADVAQDWYGTAKSESVDGAILLAGDARRGAPWDIAYNQWKDDFTRPQSVLPSRPGYVREYGDYEFGGAYSTSRVRIADGMTKLLQEAWNQSWSLNRLRPQLPWTMGFGTWEMFDHNVPWEFSVSASGLCDIFRMQKPSFWFFRSQHSPSPFVKVVGDWNPGPPKRDLVVFSNCEEVELLVNGKSIARQSPVRGGATDYADAKPFDGSNTGNLRHPPIVFRNIPYQPGLVEIKGFVNGKVVTTDRLRTVEQPEQIKVFVYEYGVPATKNDLVFFRAAVVDSHGNVCVDDSREIHITVSGAELVGKAEIVAGKGAIVGLIRTSPTASIVSIRASAPGLWPASSVLATR
ncbi:MAG: DUF4982 domain-containing protein [Armatimonadetes bacterium]|nr:DUF4982 domain-containing protein [Armatimonadota bacterium]